MIGRQGKSNNVLPFLYLRAGPDSDDKNVFGPLGSLVRYDPMSYRIHMLPLILWLDELVKLTFRNFHADVVSRNRF